MNPLENGSTMKIEELCTLFNDTISTLNSDAYNLRQLASMYMALESQDSSVENKENIRVMDENIDPNVSDRKSVKAIDQKSDSFIIKHLHEIEKLVNSLEDRTSTLNEVMNEEKKALNTLEETKKAAAEQGKIIDQILSKCDGTVVRDNVPININTIEKPRRFGSDSEIDESGSFPTLKNMKKIKTNTADSMNKTIVDIDLIKLPIVTSIEFNNMSRNIRGRIKLSVLNNALSDIEQVARNKYTILTRKSRSSMRGAKSQNNNRRTTKQFRQVLAMHRELEVSEHEGSIWISEQDMRDSCNFFRLGEGTARAILIILRSMKRLKQVSGRNSSITYILCTT